LSGVLAEAVVQEKALRFVAKCIHCGKAKNMHRAFTLDCPKGKRTPIGYSSFGPETYEAEGGEASFAAGPNTNRQNS
jgi:hypothetical protein